MKHKITKLPKSEVEIEGELEAEILESYFKKALKKLGEKVEIDGFRPGKVPEHILTSKIPEMHILEEMAEMALGEHYPKIIEESKLDVIARPEISLTKLARNNPLGFKIKTAVMPEVVLNDYKKNAKEILAEIKELKKDLEVTEEEIENTILDIRKSRAPKKKMQDMVPHEHKEGEPARPHDHSGAGEEHDHTEEVTTAPEETELPEFNDEFVKAMGPFENIADFKEKLKENLKLEKENQEREKTRLKIVEKILEEAVIDTPDVLVEMELEKILYRMESDIVAMGLKFEDYLKHLNKTVEDLKGEFKPDALKKAKLALILNEISRVENLIADEETVAKEVEHILEHYKEADPERARLHAQNVLTNEKIFQFLENL